MKPRVLKHRYSLIEILIVCGILLILAGIGISVYSLVNRKMQDSRCQAMIAKMSIALENYKAKTGYYIQMPSASTLNIDSTTGPAPNLNNFIDIPVSELNVSAGTGRGAWKDPWGMTFWYRCPGYYNRMSFDLHSSGSDKTGYLRNWPLDGTPQAGTQIDLIGADDITNWKQ